MQAITRIDVMLKLVLPGNTTPVAKRIPDSLDYKQLMSKAFALASKHTDVSEQSGMTITYKDGGANLEIEDDDDLQLALSGAKQGSKSITFLINVPQANKEAKQEDVDMKGSDDDEMPVKGKKNKTKNAKMPRKALKNLINNELEKQAKDVFTSLMKSKTLDGAMPEGKKTDEEAAQDLVEHTGVQCDGCGVSPITGIRYKCSVLPDFDYCGVCEERLDHEHAFLQIKQPGGAPEVLITILNEDEKAAKGKEEEEKKGDEPKQNDFENLFNQFAAGGFGGFGGRGCGGRGGRGRGGFGRGGRGGFGKIVSEFVEKMGIDPAEVEQHFGHRFGGRGGCHGGNQIWREKRAIINKKPEEVIEIIPGSCVIAEVEVTNGTHWPWKPGCQITMADEQNLDLIPIETFRIPVETRLEGQQSEKFEIPLTVLDHMIAGDKIYEIYVTFRGPGGKAFGQRIPIKIKVVSPGTKTTTMTEADQWKLAIKLHESGFGNVKKCLSVVKKYNGDEADCIKHLSNPEGEEE